jgi:hypothetical protein
VEGVGVTMRDWLGWQDDAWLGWVEEDAPVEEPEASAIDGSGLRIIRKRRHEPAHFKRRTPEDIRREQLETERYLASLETKSTAPAVTGVPEPVHRPKTIAPAPAVQPILADVAARAASAVQAKLEEADSAAALVLARKKRRRTLALLLALD